MTKVDNQKNQYIDGEWRKPFSPVPRMLVDPFTEQPFHGLLEAGDAGDVDAAVAAARRAFPAFSRSTVADRVELIERIALCYERRIDEFATVMAREVGIPVSARAQATGPLDHIRVARDLIRNYPFDSHIGDAIVRREPIGVCALVSPWNWPVQTPVIKAIYGIAAGCTVVLKPSDASPLSGIMLAEVMDDAGVPPGVFNLILGPGRLVGAGLAAHPDVDMVSFTGSTATGAAVGEAAARSVKRVSLELGGKSANIVLPDANIEEAARWNIQRCFFNAGQSCHAPSRMLVHESQLEEALGFLADEARKFRLGDPRAAETTMGPVVNHRQFDAIQRLIAKGIDEGARLVCGGLGRPERHEQGLFVRPTIFADVTPDMTIAREEVFGPVLAVMSYREEAQALSIANDSPYGLGGYVFSGDREKGFQFATGLRAGRVCFNGASTDSYTPMGGYKQSGIGRSMGIAGLEEYLETKSVYGFPERAVSLPEFA